MFVEERKPVFEPLVFAARTDGLVQRICRTARAEFDPVILAKARDRLFIKDHFGHRRKFDQIKLVCGALTYGIEPACAVQNVAKQVQTDRTALTRWEDIDDAATDGIVARLHDRWRLYKAHAHQKIPQGAFVNAVADSGGERRFAQDRSRWQALSRRVQRCQQNKLGWHPVHQPCQRRHTRRRDIRVRRHTIKRKAVPPREGHNRHVGRKKGQGFLHVRQALGVARHVDDGATCAFDLFQHQTGIKALWCAAHKNWCVLCHTG